MVKPVNILLVEDNEGDVRLTKEAFREGKLENEVHVVGDGRAAMAYLRCEGEYAGRPRPDLILLDLNLPLMDGREVLREVKSDPQLKGIPVVILTVSQSEEDVLKAYGLHANCFITKPLDLEEFIRVVRSIEEFWLSLVQLPRM